MKKTKRPAWPLSLPIVLMVAGLQAIGLLYYLSARAPEIRPFQWGFTYHYDAAWMASVGGSLPSFVHALGLFLVIGFLFRAIPASRATEVTGWVIAVSMLLIIECTMGTTTAPDLAAILLGAPIAFFILTLTNPPKHFASHENNCKNVRKLKWMVAGTLSTFALLGTASFVPGDPLAECARFDNDGRCVERVQIASPIYMSYNELRSSVRVSEARPMDDVGRIFVFQNTLYVNERNRGIHVIDNADPFDPQPLRFIEIPGNLDIEIRGTRLYADSFIDLVTLDISNPDEVREVDRQTDVFSWDENQNIPFNIRLNDSEIDQNLGVVIAYEVNQ